MKRTLIAFLVVLFILPLSAQTIRKAWQVQFDFGGERDDSKDLLVDPEGNYIVTGSRMPKNNPAVRAAVARITKDGNILWKWVSEEDTTATGMASIAACLQGTNFFVTQWAQYRPAKLLTFSLDGAVVDARSFGRQGGLIIATNGTRGAAVELGSNPKAYLFDADGNVLNNFVVHDYAANSHATLISDRLGFFGTDYSGQGGWNTAAFARVFDLQGNLLWARKHNLAIRAAGTLAKNNTAYLGFTQAGGSQNFTTVKYDSAGTEMWRRTWDGEPTGGTSQVSWTDDVISYPGGGCIHLGSLAKSGNIPSANLTDFGAIAYDGEGNVRWKLRFEAHPGWVRNDLWAAAWDHEGYLILVGSAYKNRDDDDHRYLVLSKWFVDGVTAVEQVNNQSLITDYYLRQNYPNPFNPRTTIEFELPEQGMATLTVYNMLGQEVETLVSEELNAGTYRYLWDANRSDRTGRTDMPSGVYFYRIETKGFIATKKMAFVK